MEECLMAFYTTICYRPEWESRSSAWQGAALQRRMATKLKCTAGFLWPGVTVCLGDGTFNVASPPNANDVRRCVSEL